MAIVIAKMHAKANSNINYLCLYKNKYISLLYKLII